jgi:hypothetical protein
MGSLTDYAGELELRVPMRITDKNNGSYPVDPGTAQDVSFSLAVPCVATDGPEGGSCAVITSADSVLPGTVVENRRTIWDVGSVELYDGGADGLAATGDNTLFARQGLFVP